MGKPYRAELGALLSTYQWARGVQIEALVESVATASEFPMYAVGSGGSLTVAHLATFLHQRFAGRVAQATTPLGIVAATEGTREVAIMYLSASGRNPDVIGSFKVVAEREPRWLGVLTSDDSSPLAALARRYDYVDFLSYPTPLGKDGFLATNSLLAAATLLARAYARAFGGEEPPEIIPPLESPETGALAELRGACSPLWDRDTLIVLYGPTAQAGAVDIESKFSEAAVAPVLLADYRNFAHGRHHWLAKRGATTGVLAFVTDDDRRLADRLLSLVPPSVPVARVQIDSGGPRAALEAIAWTLHIVGFAGDAKGLDPGRPGVPAFGRRIYNDRAFAGAARPAQVGVRISSGEAAAIERKAGTSVALLEERGSLTAWRASYSAFTTKLRQTTFRAIAFDYDGTLCASRDRRHGLRGEIAEHLVGLLESGVLVGVATGRGASVRRDLRREIPKSCWSRVLVGYYSGGDVGWLDDDAHPDSTESVCEALRPLREALERDARIMSLATLTARLPQLTVEPNRVAARPEIWQAVQHLACVTGSGGFTLVRSGHSVDILGPGVSKSRLIDVLQQVLGLDDAAILRVGDQGCWPGNDCALLSGPYSLSVDEVSTDSASCWNLAPPGHRGAHASLDYLPAITLGEGDFRLDPRRIGSAPPSRGDS